MAGHPLGEVRESHRDEEHLACDSGLFDRVVVEDLRDTSADPANPPLTDPFGPALVHIMDPLFYSTMSGPLATSSIGSMGAATM